jgi:hypothetical protein
MKKENIHIIFSLLILLVLILTSVFLKPNKTNAFSIIKPFGGRVLSWLPEAPGCAHITTAVSLATGGTIIPTIEQLKVGGAFGGTFGILRVNGLTLPSLTTIYSNKMHEIPGRWVLGSYVNICQTDNLPGKLGEIANIACAISGDSCPINKLIYKISSS